MSHCECSTGIRVSEVRVMDLTASSHRLTKSSSDFSADERAALVSHLRVSSLATRLFLHPWYDIASHSFWLCSLGS